MNIETQFANDGIANEIYIGILKIEEIIILPTYMEDGCLWKGG